MSFLELSSRLIRLDTLNYLALIICQLVPRFLRTKTPHHLTSAYCRNGKKPKDFNYYSFNISQPSSEKIAKSPAFEEDTELTA